MPEHLRRPPPPRPRLSVIIPTLDEEEWLPRTLERAGAERPGAVAPTVEVVVADGGSRDGTWDLRRRFPAVRFVRARRGRGPQMNAGAAASRGENLLFLHADTRLPDGFAALIERALARRDVAAGSFRLRFHPTSPLLDLFALCSRIRHPLFTYGDQGLFLRRSTFEAIGGFAPLPLFEDVEIQRRLRRAGRFVKLPAPVLTSARRYRARGVLRQQTLNLALVLAFHAGVGPERLASLYGRRGA